MRVGGEGDVEGVVADEGEVNGRGEGGEGFLERGGDGFDFDAEGVVSVEGVGGFGVELVVEEEDGEGEGVLEGGRGGARVEQVEVDLAPDFEGEGEQGWWGWCWGHCWWGGSWLGYLIGVSSWW